MLQHAEEVSGIVAATCRYYGISRTVFYRWKRRYEDNGLDGLQDRSSAPLHCPSITHPQVVEKIIHLRQHSTRAPKPRPNTLLKMSSEDDIPVDPTSSWATLLVASEIAGVGRHPAHADIRGARAIRHVSTLCRTRPVLAARSQRRSPDPGRSPVTATPRENLCRR